MKKNILIVNVNWLGDVVFSTPFIRAIRRNYPDSRITCMAVPRCAEVLDGNPNIDDIIAFDERDSHKGLIARLKFTRALKERGGQARTNLLCSPFLLLLLRFILTSPGVHSDR